MTDGFERLKIADAKQANEIGKLLCSICGVDPNEISKITVTADAHGRVVAKYVKVIR
jgi:hypothetical protein